MLLNEEAKEFLQDFKLKYQAEDIINRFEGLRKLKVLVIGDAIIDHYVYSSSIGKSPKENIIVVKYLSEETYAGGVLAAANHVAGFCDKVELVTCLGKMDTQERFIRQHLKKNISPTFFYREDAPTPIKRRFVEPEKMLKYFGVSILEDYPLSEDREVCDYLQCIKDYDVVLVTDFGHGLMTENIINSLRNSHFLAINTQTNTDNAGFNLILKYHTLLSNYICLDEPELRLAFRDKYGDIKELIPRLHCSKTTITHGQYPTIVYDGGFYCEIPAFSNGVEDTTGAGDAFFSVSSLCVAGGFPMDLVGFIGNAVGALKVQIVGNKFSVEPEALFKFIKELLND